VRVWSCTAAFILVLSASTAAEVQLKPFIGVTFGGNTTLLLGTEGAATPSLALGIGAVWLGEVFGVEGEIAHYPGFFEPSLNNTVTQSGLTTFTGNVVVAMPARMTRYTLRPYAVAGIAHMRAHIEGRGQDVLVVQSNLAAFDFGGGVTGFFSRHVGVNWDVRHFGSFGGNQNSPNSIGPEQLSFWRAHMAVVIRF
jgi:Outer membrane protein beta-barrel domain